MSKIRCEAIAKAPAAVEIPPKISSVIAKPFVVASINVFH